MNNRERMWHHAGILNQIFGQLFKAQKLEPPPRKKQGVAPEVRQYIKNSFASIEQLQKELGLSYTLSGKSGSFSGL